MFRLLSLALLVAGVLLLPDVALADALQFSAPLQLPHGDPNAHPFYTGGEPSIAFDPNADGHLYITAPEFIPAAANTALGLTDGGQGVAYWASDDAGGSWPRGGLTGTQHGRGGCGEASRARRAGAPTRTSGCCATTACWPPISRPRPPRSASPRTSPRRSPT